MYRSLTTWLFDGQINSDLPKKDEILKYNSPITHQFILCCFMQVPKFNHYLNEELNNFDLYKIPKWELLKFMKQMVTQLRLSFDRHYTWRKNSYITTTKLFNILWKRYPYLKRYEINMLCQYIDNLPNQEKEQYYATFGLDKPKKTKIRKTNTTKKIEHNNGGNGSAISLKDYLDIFHLEVK